MSDFQIGQLFENEYPPEVASFCSKNNCKIEVTGTVERTVQSHTLEGKQAYAVFADGTKIKLWPYNKAKYAVGQTVMMKRYKLVKIPDLTLEELEAQALAEAKVKRAEAVSKIIVEVDGMKFDGDETAQTRMGRTIAAAVALDVDINTYTQTWVLADNTVATPTIKQLAQTLKLAGEEQTKLWTVPYE